MREMLAVLVAALVLTACTTSEEKVRQRFVEWRTACGYPTGQETISEAEAQALRACIFAMEQSYQADKARKVNSGLAMMGVGSAMMGTPTPPAGQLPRSCTTAIDPGSRGQSATTTCR